jgi:hypothetical protein
MRSHKNEFFQDRAEEYFLQLRKSDFLNKSYLPGIVHYGNELVVPFFGKPFCISGDCVKEPSGKNANQAISALLLAYILNCPATSPREGDWVTYREFKGAGPLTGYFTENTNKIIETSFSGKVKVLKDAALRVGGTGNDGDESYDISMQFTVLPGIPLLLRFNDAESLFPAQCSILFRQSAEKFLDVKTLGVAGTLLVGTILSHQF